MTTRTNRLAGFCPHDPSVGGHYSTTRRWVDTIPHDPPMGWHDINNELNSGDETKAFVG